MKRFLQFVGYLAAILVLLIAVVFFRIHEIKKQLHPAETMKINQNLSVIKVRDVDFFIFTDSSNAISIDSGYHPLEIQKELSKLGISGDQIQALFLTHSDYDHTGGLSVFPKATVYLSQNEVQLLNGKTSRFFGFLPNRLDRKYQTLKDGDKFQFGNIKIQALATPGHTPGSMSYLVNGSYLFIGDTLVLNNGKVTNFVELFNMDTAAQRKTIAFLARLSNIQYLLTAHSGYATNYAEVMKEWK